MSMILRQEVRTEQRITQKSRLEQRQSLEQKFSRQLSASIEDLISAADGETATGSGSEDYFAALYISLVNQVLKDKELKAALLLEEIKNNLLLILQDHDIEVLQGKFKAAVIAKVFAEQDGVFQLPSDKHIQSKRIGLQDFSNGILFPDNLAQEIREQEGLAKKLGADNLGDGFFQELREKERALVVGEALRPEVDITTYLLKLVCSLKIGANPEILAYLIDWLIYKNLISRGEVSDRVANKMIKEVDSALREGNIRHYLRTGELSERITNPF